MQHLPLTTSDFFQASSQMPPLRVKTSLTTHPTPNTHTYTQSSSPDVKRCFFLKHFRALWLVFLSSQVFYHLRRASKGLHLFISHLAIYLEFEISRNSSFLMMKSALKLTPPQHSLPQNTSPKRTLSGSPLPPDPPPFKEGIQGIHLIISHLATFPGLQDLQKLIILQDEINSEALASWDHFPLQL